MIFRRARIVFRDAAHALLHHAQMHLRAVGKFLAGTRDDFFQLLLGLLIFLLVQQQNGLFVKFQLGLHQRVNQLNGSLGRTGASRQPLLFQRLSVGSGRR